MEGIKSDEINWIVTLNVVLGIASDKGDFIVPIKSSNTQGITHELKLQNGEEAKAALYEVIDVIQQWPRLQGIDISIINGQVKFKLQGGTEEALIRVKIFVVVGLRS